jgi:hypothetical protein
MQLIYYVVKLPKWEIKHILPVASVADYNREQKYKKRPKAVNGIYLRGKYLFLNLDCFLA